jgi:hypothetical protein
MSLACRERDTFQTRYQQLMVHGQALRIKTWHPHWEDSPNPPTVDDELCISVRRDPRNRDSFPALHVGVW